MKVGGAEGGGAKWIGAKGVGGRVPGVFPGRREATGRIGATGEGCTSPRVSHREGDMVGEMVGKMVGEPARRVGGSA